MIERDLSIMAESFTRALAAVDPLITAVTPSQLDNPTPCPGWSVRTLIRHLADVQAEFAAIASGEPAPDQGVDPVAHAGDGNPIAAFRQASLVARAVFSRPGMPERIYQFPWGEEPGAKIVQHVVDEMLIHGWDLATATGHPANFPPDLVEQSLQSWRQWFAEWPRAADDNFGPERPAPVDGSPTDRLAAFLGRPPWEGQ